VEFRADLEDAFLPSSAVQPPSEIIRGQCVEYRCVQQGVALRLASGKREEHGFAAANNRQSPPLWKISVPAEPDTVARAALDALVDFMDAHPAVWACGPGILNRDGTPQRTGVRFPSLWNILVETFFLDRVFPSSRVFGRHMELYEDPVQARHVDYVQGSCLMIRRDVVRKVGALDESYFMYFEETDLCYRIKQAGGEVWIVPSAGVVHLGGDTTGHFDERRVVFYHKSLLRFFDKHHTLSGRIAVRILVFVRSLIRIFSWCIVGIVKPAPRGNPVFRRVHALPWISRNWIVGHEGAIFSLIIPTYNRAALHLCLDALARQTIEPGQCEVIVVVDGSTDGTTEMLRSLTFPFSFTFITLDNGGASRARNKGVEVARGRYLGFTEYDVVPEPDWLTQAMRRLREENVDVLEGLTVYKGSAGSVRRFEPPGVMSFIPCNLFVRRTAFLASGGYDQSFFDRKEKLYFREDSDLGFRLLDAGCSVAHSPDLIVAHPPQFGSLGECLRHARRYFFDPLLYKRHRRRYREMIEVKRLGGVTIHRPQHYIALGDLVAVVVGLVGVASGNGLLMGSGLAVSIACALLFRLKYQGRKALSLKECHVTLGFWIVPFVYLLALIRGCIRFRTVGVLF
jgi:GT2 family glycosyltransferase